MRIEIHKNLFRMLVIGFLLVVSAVLTSWLYYSEESSFFYVSFFYLPVVLACLWWGRKGIILALASSLCVLALHLVDPGTTSFAEDLVRVLALLLTGMIIGEMSERQQRLMRQLSRQREELKEFSHSVSHDLKGPVSTIKGFAEVALEGGAGVDDDLTEECLRNIVSSSDRMRESIDSLLALAESGDVDVAPMAVDPNDIVADVLRDFSLGVNGNGARTDLEKGLPTIWANPDKLKQVFSNLVSNALKFSKGDVPLHLEIGCRPHDREAVFFVRDNGKGMEENVLNEIFAPFKRYDTSVASGSGLGLSIARRAVESWGGRIWAESEPGKGSTFFFTAFTSAAE